MDDEEAILKKKLENTEDIDERREIRRQIRELRNKKFDEELQKISSGQVPATPLTNGVITKRKSFKKTESIEEQGDPYGLLQYVVEEELQELLNDTPFTETDKRRKIRARMREIRNAKIDGITLEPVKKVSKEPDTENSKSANENSNTDQSAESDYIQKNTYSRSQKEETSSIDNNDISLSTKIKDLVNEYPQIQESEKLDNEINTYEKHKGIETNDSENENIKPHIETSKESSIFDSEPSEEINYNRSSYKFKNNYRKYNKNYEDDNNEEEIERPSKKDNDIDSYNTKIYDDSANAVNTKNINDQLQTDIVDDSQEKYSQSDKEDDETDLSVDKEDTEKVDDSVESPKEHYTEVNNNQKEDQNISDQNDSSFSPQGSVSGSPRSSISSESSTSRNFRRPGDVVDDVLATPEPGINSGGDFKDRLKKNVRTESPNFERSVKGGEQVDFRGSLKKKSKAPAVNLERKLQGPGQIDFRSKLQRKVNTQKKEFIGGEQVDFRVALKKKVDKPVFDKPTGPAVQVDFRTALQNKVETKAPVDRPGSADQKDFRVVLGKNQRPESQAKNTDLVKDRVVENIDPKEEIKNEEKEATSSDDISLPKQECNDQGTLDLESNEETPEIDSVTAQETPMEVNDAENVEIKESEKPLSRRKKLIADEAEKQEEKEPMKKTKKPPPPAPKKKAPPSVPVKSENKVKKDSNLEINAANNRESNVEINGIIEDNDDDNTDIVVGKARNRNSRLLRKEIKDNDSNELSNKELETNHEENKQEEPANDSSEETENMPIRTGSNRSVIQSKAMSRIKFGSDDESEKEKPVEQKEENKDSEEPEEPETVVFNVKNEAGSENRRASRRNRNQQEEEKIEVSADLLAEINKPKEEPKPKTFTPFKKTVTEAPKRALTPRELERQKEREKREKEREERAAQRAKEREEAARKRKEQKEAFDKKMAERKLERARAERNKMASTRANRNAFKDQLEKNAGPVDQEKASSIKSNTNVAKLLAWVQHRTDGYNGVNIENFSDSWADGLAFAALIHSYCPEDIPFNDLTKETQRKNFEHAFNIAREEGVLDLLDVDDMVRMHSPDPKSIITYLHSVYSVFEG